MSEFSGDILCYAARMLMLRSLYCLIRGHRWTHSRTREGYRTCKRCKRREPDPAYGPVDERESD